MSNDALDLANASIEHFRSKADHNKSESLFCFSIIVLFSLISPMFVMLGEGVILGKIIPSLLSLFVAASTAWLQLRRPQHLWSIYRDSQRRIEDILCKYKFGIEEFSFDNNQRDTLLADHTRAIIWETHKKWLPLVPSSDSLEKKENSNID